jgi:hypothetical protein
VPNVIEPGVVAGHAAVLHGARVGADTLVGVGAKLLSGSVIGAECVIAAGAVVPPGMTVPPRSVVMGLPGKVVRPATAEEIAHTRTINARYREMARRYAAGGIAYPFGKPGREKDWRSVVGMFDDDPEFMQDVLAEAQALREAEQKAAREAKAE